jgi:hypothetical protein
MKPPKAAVTPFSGVRADAEGEACGELRDLSGEVDRRQRLMASALSDALGLGPTLFRTSHPGRPDPGGREMNRNAPTVRATLFVAAALTLSVWQGVASASGKTNVSWTIKGSYTCSANCDFTDGSGIAHSDSKVLSRMTWINQGGPGTGALVCPKGEHGVRVGENWAFATQKGGKDTFDIKTDSDNLCFVSGQISKETGTFHITDGTGRFKGATGRGTFEITDLTNPPNENGTFKATINLP